MLNWIGNLLQPFVVLAFTALIEVVAGRLDDPSIEAGTTLT